MMSLGGGHPGHFRPGAPRSRVTTMSASALVAAAVAMGPVEEGCASCGQAPATARCSACRAVNYCSRDCQVADLADHKPRCAFIKKVVFNGRAERVEETGIEDGVAKALADVPAAGDLPRRLLRASNADRLRWTLVSLFNMDADRVRALLGPGTRVTSKLADPNGNTVFQYATDTCGFRRSTELRERALTCWKLLLEQASVAEASTPWLLQVAGHVRSHTKLSTLEFVCLYFDRASQEEAVAALIAKGAPVDAVNPASGTTALFSAVERSPAGVVRALLEAGASARVKNPDGTTLLHSAAAMEVPDAAEKVRLLMAAGADPAAARMDGLTAVQLALVTRHGSLRALRAMLALGADLPAAIAGVPTACKLYRGFSAVHVAADHANAPVMRLLLSPPYRHLVDVDARSPANERDVGPEAVPGMTPLHLAAMAGKTGAAVAALLLGAGANPAVPNAAGESPLQYALNSYNYEVAKLLLKSGVLPAVFADKAAVTAAFRPLFSAAMTAAQQLPLFEALPESLEKVARGHTPASACEAADKATKMLKAAYDAALASVSTGAAAATAPGAAASGGE
jgi:uncharacterized protein